MEQMAISKFKAHCLAVLEEVRRTGKPVLVTKRGKPIAEIVPPKAEVSDRESLIGFMKGTGKITGDIVGPAVPAEAWDVLRDE
jgi:prevent-host-death family protein